jgi:hypothetical protein
MASSERCGRWQAVGCKGLGRLSERWTINAAQCAAAHSGPVLQKAAGRIGSLLFFSFQRTVLIVLFSFWENFI